jgi:hypothetical protein
MTEKTQRERLDYNLADLRELLSDDQHEMAECYAEVGARIGRELVASIVDTYNGEHWLAHDCSPPSANSRRHLRLVAESLLLACYSLSGLEIIRRLSTAPPPTKPTTAEEAAAANHDAFARRIGQHMIAMASEAIDARHRQETGQPAPDDVLFESLLAWAQGVLKLKVGTDPFAGLNFDDVH